MNNAAVEERHIKLQAERINQATWPGKDLWEIAELQLKLEAAERRIEELETQASEHTRWVLRNSVDKVELEALREESQQNRAEISSLKAALKAADDRAEMARQGNLYIETFPKPPYIATCKTEELP